MIDPSRAFGTVITVGASVVALKMVSSLEKNVRNTKSRPLPHTFTLKSMPSKQYGIRPLKFRR